MVEGTWTPNNTEQKFRGEMTDLLLADCFLPESPVMQGFFHESNEGVPAAGLVITVSNDGDHKSSENLTFISYDSACMSCNISTGCVLKVCQCSTKQRKPLVNIKLHCGFLISKCSKLNGPFILFGATIWKIPVTLVLGN